jgi:acetyl-CoA C-acetyltransferase
MKAVAIVGVGQTAFVRGYEGSIRELAFDAYKEAMLDAGLKAKDIDASIICSAPEYDKQRTPAGTIVEYRAEPQAHLYVETVCSSLAQGCGWLIRL